MEDKANEQKAGNKVGLMVHESESQRQFVRVKLPARIQVGDITYNTGDWSVGGVCLKLTEAQARTGATVFRAGSLHDGLLHFNFDGFQLGLQLRLEVRHYNAEKASVGCRFVDLDERQLSILQLLVNSYISGEFTDVGDVIDVVKRSNFVQARKLPSVEEDMTAGQRLVRRLGVLTRVTLLAATSIALLLFVAMSVYERMYVVSATSATVTADLVSISSPASGNIFYKALESNTKVEKGEALFTVSTETGNLLSADSPCHCTVKKRLFANKELVRKGQPAMYLATEDVAPYVSAFVRFKDAVKLAEDQPVVLRLIGRDIELKGTITNIEGGDGPQSYTRVTILPAEPISPKYIDDPVEVDIDTLGFLLSKRS